MSFTRKKNPINYSYNIDGISLQRQTIVKDLGIYFDSELTFAKHILARTSEAIRMLGFIIRNCKQFNNLQALKLLYYSYVRSKLEYGSIIWSPYYQIHSNNVEQVQRKFLKFLLFKSTGQYPERGIEQDLFVIYFTLQIFRV